VHERDLGLFDAVAGALAATGVERALDAALREIVRALELPPRGSGSSTPAPGGSISPPRTSFRRTCANRCR
jgi:hypothetical protein